MRPAVIMLLIISSGAVACRSETPVMSAAVLAPDTLPSARVLAEMKDRFGGSHDAFTRAHSLRTREHMLALPLAPAVARTMAELATESLAAQALPAADIATPNRFEIERLTGI